MIKPEDLRIGNWVNHHGEIITVDGIDDIDVFNKKCGEIPLHSILPIPLTEKILLDCGCKKRPEGFIGFKIFAGTYLEINISKKRTIIFLEDGSKCVDLKHNGFLHEFQNTIYSLTKTELIIKL